MKTLTPRAGKASKSSGPGQPNRSRPFTESDLDEIDRKLRAGGRASEIAREMGLLQSTFFTRLARSGRCIGTQRWLAQRPPNKDDSAIAKT